MISECLVSAVHAYRSRFGVPPTAAAAAPGRIEVLGNHTDYNGGLVMSAAIGQVTVVAGARDDSGAITLLAVDKDDEASFGSNGIQANQYHSWASYLLGVAHELQKAGIAVGGFRGTVKSDVAIGAGLSSSAALEVATALFLQQLYPFEMEKMDLARLCQRAENHFVGVSSGLLDQFSSMFGAAHSLLYLDCLTLEHGKTTIPRDDVSLVVCHSMNSHSLTSGHYNERREECMAAAAHFGKTLLRQVDVEEFHRRKHELPENVRKRAEHVIAENGRVVAGREAAAIGDLHGLGAAMTASHQSSRFLFENSTPDLDFLVDTAVTLPGCYGARLTGGGWGGAIVGLVDSSSIDSFRQEISRRFEQHSGKTPKTFVCEIADGARAVAIPEPVSEENYGWA